MKKMVMQELPGITIFYIAALRDMLLCCVIVQLA